MLFLLPAGTTVIPAIVVALVGALFVGPMTLHPIREKLEPWATVERPPFTWLPVELTLINDLPVRLHPERGRIPFTHVPEVFLTYMDSRTYYAEADPAAPGIPIGFWIAGDASTDIVIRTERPLKWLRLDLSGKHVPNHVTATVDGRTTSVDIDANGRATLLLHPDEGQWYHLSYGVVLHLSTTQGFVPARIEGGTDERNLGVFVRPLFSVTATPPVRGLPPAGHVGDGAGR